MLIECLVFLFLVLAGCGLSWRRRRRKRLEGCIESEVEQWQKAMDEARKIAAKRSDDLSI